MAAPNLQIPTTVTGKIAVQAVGTSASAIVSNAAASGFLKRVTSLIIGNVTTAAATVVVDVYRSSTAYRIAKDLVVPANGTVAVITRDAALNLEEGDDLRLTGSATSTLEAVASYEQVA